VRAPVLVLRSLLYRWRTNLAVAAGAALGTAVLIGALGAGDSVRYSLRRIALDRLGRIEFALEAGERFFHAGLAGELAVRLGGRGAALIALSGAASARGGEARVSPVQVLGVSEEFWALGPEAASSSIGAEELLLNEPLARRLGVGPGEEVLLRVPSSFLMPGEAPLSVGAEDTAALRLTVKAVLPDRGFGNFSLRVSQAAPLNAFVSRELLAARLGRAGRANLILLEAEAKRSPAEVERALADSFRLEDAGLALRRAGAGWELVSERVFLEPPVERAALAEGGRGVLTYFVERISSAGRSLHYAFVSAPGAPRVPEDLGEGELCLNRWAASELGAGPGDQVELEFLVPGPAPGSPLEKRVAEFRLREVVPIEPGDRSLMPAFPGLAGVKNCRDWDPGMPIDISLIGERDQRYWDTYGGSPKAFVSLPAAQTMWANRFGRLTALRFGAERDAGSIAAGIMSRLPPRSLGLAFLPVREIGLTASAHGVDFGQLFLGLSFFLITSALLLTALLFLLSVEQRAEDTGILASLGFTRGRIRRLLLAEGALVALAGSTVGALLGLAYHRGILVGLKTVWRDAVRTPAVLPYIAPHSVVLGFAGGLAAALAVIGLATISLLRIAPARSLRGLPAPQRPERGAAGNPRRSGLAAGILAGVCAAGAGLFVAVLSPPTSFFAAGALLLAASLALVAFILARLGRPRSSGRLSMPGVGLENAARRRSRSLAVASLMACGIFIVTAVAANRLGVPHPDRRESGTGGFQLIVETAVPVSLDTERRLAGAEQPEPGLVGFRVLEGDDASCLNLNRVRQPRILGVDPTRLGGRFSFAAFSGGRRVQEPWSLLEEDLGPGVVPAVADQSVITWGLGLKIGDELEYRDEQGSTLRIRLVAGLANSIFQGNLIVAEGALVRHFPSSSGHRLFLLEERSERRGDLVRAIGRSLSRYGVSVVPATERLAEFNSVQNAYLTIYGLLGWLGMLIGTLGLAIVVARNVAESRRELALLRAVGFGRPALSRYVLAEHLLPLGLGLAGGLIASGVAVYPAASLQGAALPIGSLLVPMGAIIVSAVACVVITVGIALRADLLTALRNE
jgi:putative ABC transport system permease protein